MAEPVSSLTRDVKLHQAIVGEFGHVLRQDSVVLDFGCGDGELVQAYRAAGIQAFGADVRLEQPGPWLRVIAPAGGAYRLPFDDGTFDFVYSNSVLEHVEDLSSALAEVHRVMKPGAASLHLFPPAGKPIEPHVYVPLGGLLQVRPWLLLWALMGVRNSFQHGLGFRAAADSNYRYLHTKTFYRSKRELNRQFRRYFTNVTFADREMIRHSYGKAGYLAPYAEKWSGIGACYGMLHQRCVFFEKS